jgi:small conductance mechanosensitive channel
MKTTWSLVEEKLEAWWIYSVKMLPNFVLAILVLAFFFVLARIFRRLTFKFILRISKSISVSSLLSGILYTGIFMSGLMSALDILGLDKPVSSLLAGVGIIGLALGFAFQDITSNFISGAFIALKRPFDVGHIIETNGFTGTIEEMQLRATTLRTSEGLHVIIPNKDIFQKPIINYSRTDARKVELDFRVPNNVDAVFMEKLIIETVESISGKNHFRNLEFYYTSIEPPDMKIHVAFWTHRIEPGPFMKARHKAIIAICNAFRDHGIYEIRITGPTPAHQPPTGQNG